MNKRNNKEDKELIKSLYKYMLEKHGKTASMKSPDKETAQTIVEDVLDSDDEAEVNPDKINVPATRVLNKDADPTEPLSDEKADAESTPKRVKGVKRLKNYYRKKRERLLKKRDKNSTHPNNNTKK